VQSFTFWQEATIDIPRPAQSVSACSHHITMGVVRHAYPVRGEAHISNNADWEAATLAARLEETLKWLSVKETSKIQTEKT